MNFFHYILAIASLLVVSMTPAPITPAADTAEIHFGLMEAVVGLNPQTSRPSGWYTSNVSIPVIAPLDVLVNGKPLVGGRLVVSDEGQHQIKFQPGFLGQANAVTQFVSIDKTPPLVAWLTAQQTTFSMPDALEAEITDPISGICVLEVSFDQSRIWEDQFFPAPLPGETGLIQETAWAKHLDFREFPQECTRLFYAPMTAPEMSALSRSYSFRLNSR